MTSSIPTSPQPKTHSGGTAKTHPLTMTKTYRGAQILYLSYYSKGSMDNLLKACSGLKSGQSFAFAFAPYIKDQSYDFRKDNMYDYYTNKTGDAVYNYYDNAIRLVTALTGKGVKVTVTVHFAFHAGGKESFTDLAYHPELQLRVLDFKSKFLPQNSSSVRLVACPSLEDDLDETGFEDHAQVLLTQLGDALETDASGNVTNLILQRSHNDPKELQKTPQILKSTDPDTPVQIKVLREIHGAIHDGFDVYSNDGNFVWFDNVKKKHLRTEKSDPNANANYDPQSPKSPGNKMYGLSDFIVKTKGKKYPILLFRPSYNLWTFSGGRFNKGPNPKDRDDAGAPHFDAVEIEVLREYLADAK